MGFLTTTAPVAKPGKGNELILYIDYSRESAGRDGNIELTINEYDFSCPGIRNLGYRSDTGFSGLHAETAYYFDSMGTDRDTRRFHTKRSFDGRYINLTTSDILLKMGRALAKLDNLETAYSRTSANGGYHSDCEMADYVERFAKLCGATRVAVRIPGTGNGRSGYDAHEYEWLTIAGGAAKVRELHAMLLTRGDGKKVNPGDGYTINW